MADEQSTTVSVAQSGPVPSSIPGYAVTPGMGGPPQVVSAVDRVNQIVQTSPAMKALWDQMPATQKIGIAINLARASRELPQAQARPQSARDMDAALYGAAGSALGNMGAKYPYTSVPGQPGLFANFEAAAPAPTAQAPVSPGQSPWVVELLQNIGIDLPSIVRALSGSRPDVPAAPARPGVPQYLSTIPDMMR